MKSRLNQYLITGKPVSFKRFSGKIMPGIIVVLILLSAGQKVQAQVQATGHVFAEIVEPTALYASTNNQHFLSGTDNYPNEELFLAEVKLSGRDVNVDVSVQSGLLEAANGETLRFDAFACPTCNNEDPNHMTGEKLFTLIGTPRTTSPQRESNSFKGQYRVTFMYN